MRCQGDVKPSPTSEAILQRWRVDGPEYRLKPDTGLAWPHRPRSAENVVGVAALCLRSEG
jgi:hypothetical protein